MSVAHESRGPIKVVQSGDFTLKVSDVWCPLPMYFIDQASLGWCVNLQLLSLPTTSSHTALRPQTTTKDEIIQLIGISFILATMTLASLPHWFLLLLSVKSSTNFSCQCCLSDNIDVHLNPCDISCIVDGFVCHQVGGKIQIVYSYLQADK